ncbi:hypothetical protein AB4090_04315 [Acidithiobacillus sp. IBUN Pt1247-S3]
MKLTPYLGLAILATAIAGCASATNNGLPPSGQAMPPLPQPAYKPSAQPSMPTPPKITLPAVPKQPLPAIREENLPTQALAPVPMVPTVSTLESKSLVPVPSSVTAITGSNFAHIWTKDLGSARTQSTACIGDSGAQRASCWQGVANWAQTRATMYGKAETLLGGAQAEQAGAAQKFFQTTSQWASACSSLSATDCAKSPLIAKMQQWKSSVGIGASKQ